GTRSATRPDGAIVGSTICHTWTDGSGCYGQFDDLTTETPIRTPIFFAFGGRMKVVSDGVRFWIYVDGGGPTVTAYAFGQDGGGRAAAHALARASAGPPWDVMAMPGTGTGSVIASNAPGQAYARLAFATYSAGVAITGPVNNTHLPCMYALGWLQNDFDPT